MTQKNTNSPGSIYSKKEANYNAEKSVEEIVKEFRKKQNLIEPDGFLADVGEDYEAVDFNTEVMENWLTQTLQAERQKQDEMVEKAYDFVSKYKAKYQGCGMADSMLALDEMLQAITHPNNHK